MPVELDWSFDVREAEEFFEFAGYKARNMRPGFERLKSWMRKEIFSHFVGQIDAEGSPWMPLTERYAVWKESKVGAMPLLEFYLPLFRAANADRSYSVSPFDFHYSVYVPNRAGDDYAEWHETGSTKMVARPWFIPEAMLTDEIDRIFTDWLNEVKDRNKRRRGNPSLTSLGDISITL